MFTPPTELSHRNLDPQTRPVVSVNLKLDDRWKIARRRRLQGTLTKGPTFCGQATLCVAGGGDVTLCVAAAFGSGNMTRNEHSKESARSCAALRSDGGSIRIITH